MNRMHIFLLGNILLLSQQMFSMFWSQREIKQIEDRMYFEKYGRYPASEKELSKQQAQKSPKKSTIAAQTTTLKGSTDKANDNK